LFFSCAASAEGVPAGMVRFRFDLRCVSLRIVVSSYEAHRRRPAESSIQLHTGRCACWRWIDRAFAADLDMNWLQDATYRVSWRAWIGNALLGSVTP